MMKVLRVALPVALVVALVLGVALPGLAASDEAVAQNESNLRPGILRGTVAGVDEDEEFFSIKVGDRIVEIDVSAGTKYYLLTRPPRLSASIQLGEQEMLQVRTKAAVTVKPGGVDQALPLRPGRASGNPALAPVDESESAPDLLPPGLRRGIAWNWQELLKWLRQFGQEAGYDDIDVGDRIVVGVVSESGNPLAKVVLIIEASPHQRVAGTILSVDDDTITLDTVDDPIHYDDHTIFILRGTPSLEEGMRAVVIYVEEDGVLLAKRVTAGLPQPEPLSE